ncbi:MAG: hypothetical protein M1549_03325 [Candidatus Dependentiae bacterium]|nr:hypothetical protein [Candidatus Dependentiae bacterium]
MICQKNRVALFACICTFPLYLLHGMENKGLESCPICTEPLSKGSFISLHPDGSESTKKHRVHNVCLWQWLKSLPGASRYNFVDEQRADEGQHERCIICNGKCVIKNSDMRIAAVELLKSSPLKQLLAPYPTRTTTMPLRKAQNMVWQGIQGLILILWRIADTPESVRAAELDAESIDQLVYAAELIESLRNSMAETQDWKMLTGPKFKAVAAAKLQIDRLIFKTIDAARLPLPFIEWTLAEIGDKSLVRMVLGRLFEVSEESLAKRQAEAALTLKDLEKDLDLSYRFLSRLSAKKQLGHIKKILKVCLAGNLQQESGAVASGGDSGTLVLLSYLPTLSFALLREYWTKLPLKKQRTYAILASTTLRGLCPSSGGEFITLTCENLDVDARKPYLDAVMSALLFQAGQQGSQANSGLLGDVVAALAESKELGKTDLAGYWRHLMVEVGWTT